MIIEKLYHMHDTKTAIDIFNKHAQLYQDKYMHLDLYNDTFDLFCNNIAQDNAEILDVACGPGNITRYLLKKRPDFKVLGIDLSINMINLAKLNNPTAEFLMMDCRKIGLSDKKFDGIICGFCLPYLSKAAAVKLINDAARLLKPNGVFYLSTMEENEDKKSGLKTSSTGDQMYLYYHQAEYLINALQENNFKIIDVRHQDYPTQDGTKTTDLIILARR